MFCPQCGQQQPADAVRFCKRCGMALERLAEFVESGVQLTAAGELSETRALTARQRGTRLGMVGMIAGFVFGVIAVLLTAMNDDLFVFIPVAALVFMVGVVRFLYGVLLEEDAPRRPKAELADEPRRLALVAPPPAALPHARTTPINAHTAPGPDTKDMAAPRASVTEQTTKLLEEE